MQSRAPALGAGAERRACRPKPRIISLHASGIACNSAAPAIRRFGGPGTSAPALDHAPQQPPHRRRRTAAGGRALAAAEGQASVRRPGGRAHAP
eukprot:scaffold900_cov430-Prasinococcus_capsulatus_cf.AAC.11